MIARKFKVIYLPENSSKILEFNFSRIKLFLLLAATGSLLIILTIYSVDYLTDGLYNFKIRNLRKDKLVMKNQLLQMHRMVENLKTEVDEVMNRDDEMRVAVDLPNYNEDVREVGVGGGEIWKPTLSSFYSDEEGMYAGMNEELNKLERQIEFEFESYKEIYEKLELNKEMVKYWPAIRPVEGGRITDGFKWRRHPITGIREFHRAIDISVKKGTPIYAAADGVIKYAEKNGLYGNYIRIDHNSKKFGYETAYAHLNKFRVKKGQKIKRGEIIGEVGRTGSSTAPHLHYEVWFKGNIVNPNDYYYDPNILY